MLFPNADSVPEGLAFVYRLTGIFGADSNTALPVILSWIVTVSFAYCTNRIFVFTQKADSFFGILREILFFFLGRIFTLVVEMMIMYLLIDLPQLYGFFYEFLIKSICAVVVTILNYIISKFFIFRKKVN